MSWTPERIADLEKLWAEGLSTAEIGRRMGITKNAVVGKAHRLALPGRQSPIDASRRQARGNPAPQPQATPTAAPTVAATAAPRPAARPATTPKPVAAPAAAKPAAAAARKPVRKHSGPACQWPFGDPRLPGFHFCGAPSEPGKPYCNEHCALAYNRVSNSQADARAAKEAA